MTLGVARQQTSGSRQRGMMTNGGKHIAEFALPRRRITDPIGGQQGEFKRAGNFDGGTVARFLLAMKMALQFHIDVAATKDVDQVFYRTPRFFHAALRQRRGERTIITPGEADEPGRMLLQLFSADSAFAFLRPQFHLCDQAAEVLVAGAGTDEKGKSDLTPEAQRHREIRRFKSI